jgi:acetyl-CoA decarbonylase/synthase complex subunit gamma
VSANYKLSFDRLRQELEGVAAWIMVLDTEGINVWCAAGKGTFGTEEIIRRIEATGLAALVFHRTLILPQLGAPGVAAHQVKKQSGFRIVYGPICARDIPSFLQNKMQATPDMRRVRFSLRDRLAVVPVELVQGGRYALPLAAGLFLLAGLGRGGYDSGLALRHGGRAALLVLAAYLGGGLVAPLLLPWLPGRAFSGKGAVVGLALAGAAILGGWCDMRGTGGWLEASAWLLIMPAIAAFMAMNFTGASTYTSLSGVKKEMRFAVPMQVAAGAVGIGLWMAARFFT